MKDILKELIPLFCAAIGWGFSELTRFWTNAEQKKQTLNTALSILLDIYFHLKRIQEMHVKTREFLDWYTSALKGRKLRDDEIFEVKKLLTKSLIPTIFGVVSDDMNKISSRYEESVEKLSCYYPVVAYRLRGQANVENILIDLHKYSSIMEEQLSLQISDYVDMIVAPNQDQLYPVLFESHLTVLRDELLKLANETNCKHRKEILETIENIDKPNDLATPYLDSIKHNVLTLIEDNL